MSKKHIIITSALVVISFIIGFFVGDSSAISRVNKEIDKKVSSASTNTTPEAKKDTPKVEEKKEEKTYKVGDTIKIDDKYEVTITKVSLTKERNEVHEQKFEKVAVIEYSYKNLNSDKDLFIGSSDFKVYDEEGNALSTYPVGANKYPQNIAKGKQCVAEMSYGFNKGSKLELQYYDNVFAGKANAKIIVDVQ